MTISYYPEKEVDNIKGWHWISSDTGAWDGPKRDWETSHKRHILQYVKNFGCAVQAGGNLGMYPKLLSKMFNHVITFEPDDLNYDCLKKNLEDVDNVAHFKVGLGESPGAIIMHQITMENVGMHRAIPVSREVPGAIPLVKLDFMRMHACDLLMLDLEGFEPQAIKGAVNTINRFRPVIFAENPSYVLDIMDTLGYTMFGQSEMDGVFVPN